MIPISSLSSPIASQFLQPSNLASKKLEQMGAPIETQAGSATGAAPSFGKIITNFVQEVDTQQKISGAERNKVLTGETTNLHQAMIASQEASVGFTFMVELRNKLVESYQELMRSQV